MSSSTLRHQSLPLTLIPISLFPFSFLISTFNLSSFMFVITLISTSSASSLALTVRDNSLSSSDVMYPNSINDVQQNSSRGNSTKLQEDMLNSVSDVDYTSKISSFDSRNPAYNTTLNGGRHLPSSSFSRSVLNDLEDTDKLLPLLNEFSSDSEDIGIEYPDPNLIFVGGVESVLGYKQSPMFTGIREIDYMNTTDWLPVNNESNINETDIDYPNNSDASEEYTSPYPVNETNLMNHSSPSLFQRRQSFETMKSSPHNDENSELVTRISSKEDITMMKSSESTKLFSFLKPTSRSKLRISAITSKDLPRKKGKYTSINSSEIHHPLTPKSKHSLTFSKIPVDINTQVFVDCSSPSEVNCSRPDNHPNALAVSSGNVANVKRNTNKDGGRKVWNSSDTNVLYSQFPPPHIIPYNVVPPGVILLTSDDIESKVNITDRQTLSILGLFEMTTRLGERIEGRSELAAARMAVKHINARNILPGYQLVLHTNDTKCDPGVGVDAFFHALYTQNATRMVMLLGTACSDVTESLAKVMPYWNIVQVSFGSTSPALSDRKEFPLFYRTVAPDSSHNPARLAFVHGFGWDTVTALSQNEDVYSLAVNDLVTELEHANITCRATITFAETDFKDQLRMLRDLDTRIIIGSFSHEVAPKIFCEAYHLGMYGSDYAWILQGSPNAMWWKNVTQCPQHQLAAAVEGLLLVSSHNSIVGVTPGASGLTNSKFLEEFEALSLPVTRYAPQTYDAVWAIALALRGAHHKWLKSKEANTPKLHQFDYTRRDMAEEFLQQLGEVSFLGVSGPVSFSGADRVGISAFYQVQEGEVSKVALFYPSNGHLDFSCPDCEPLVWQGGQVPIAKRVFKLRVVTIEPAAFLSITCLASIGITLAIAFLAFNLHFRKLKYIKLSSPRLNNMAVVGCILVYTAVILLGLDHATLPTNTHFPAVCTARVYLLSAGFSLAFGSMFTKTYRVHRIFTRSRSGVVKNKLLQDTQLISLICVLLLIDGLIVTLWVIIDPIQRHLRNLTLEISASDRSVVYQPQVEVCRSQYIHGWLGALYVYKGLLLVVGVYMAWETRHVKIPALNDSQYIGMSVYSVVITSGIVVVLANLISERATLAFVTITTLILTSTTATLCLLFLPKLHAILGHMDNGDPIIHSMGLKIECNTRRFVMDDRRELYYRVEVQNRVYRREMAALDLEIVRLKRQLVESPTGSSGSTSSLGNGSRRGDFSPLDENIILGKRMADEPPSPSVGGGLPMLLLSVLPPVIPRASWPSADRGVLPMRRQVTFSSEPKLDDSACKGGEDYSCSPDDDATFAEVSTKLGVLGRLWNFLGSRPSSRKTSTASFTGTATGGIASALRVHMGYLAGLVPSSGTTNAPVAMVSSCSSSTVAVNQYGLGLQQYVAASSRELHPLKKFCGRVGGGGSGPIISVTSNDSADNVTLDSDESSNANRRKFSLSMCLSRKEEGERRTSSSSSYSHKGCMPHQHSQPILPPFRERARGSPRFPHKIVPTCSLNALEDRRKSSSSAAGVSSCALNPTSSNVSHFVRRRSSQHYLHVRSRSAANCDHLMTDKCRSLEDAACMFGSAGASQIPGTSGNWKPRAASYSPNCDVWATAEFGIPLSELANSNRSRERNVSSSHKDSQ